MSAIFADTMEVKAVITILILAICLLLSVALLMQLLLKPKKMKMAYAIMAIIIGVLLSLGWIMTFSYSETLFITFLLYCPALILAYLPLYGVKEKKWIVLPDALCMFLIMPFLQFNKYTIIYYFLNQFLYVFDFSLFFERILFNQFF